MEKCHTHIFCYGAQSDLTPSSDSSVAVDFIFLQHCSPMGHACENIYTENPVSEIIATTEHFDHIYASIVQETTYFCININNISSYFSIIVLFLDFGGIPHHDYDAIYGANVHVFSVNIYH